ncbi:MAG TPA: hypothetical protein VNW04_03975 [Puia sp.]|jgi:hypothetical protein|nr:hypothetical protein [Puia sp.]
MNLYIDIAISMVLIFLVFSVIVYVIQELVAVNGQYRGKMLWRAMAQLLDNAEFKDKRAIGKDGQKSPDKPTPLTNLFFDHAQIKTLQRDNETAPPYIPAENVAIALVDLVAQSAPEKSGNLLNDFASGLTTLAGSFDTAIIGFLPPTPKPGSAPTTPKPASAPAPPIVAVLQSVAQISTSIDDLRKNIEKWYNEYMNRVTGWYQAHTVLTIRLIAIAITLGFNLNAIRLVKDISNDSVLRTNLVGISERVTDHPDVINDLYNRRFEKEADSIRNAYKPAIDSEKDKVVQARLSVERDSVVTKAATKYTDLRIASIRTLTDMLSAVHLPIGWHSNPFTTCWNKFMALFDKPTRSPAFVEILLALLGWLITAGCLSMGAPFWFNLLIQLVNVRRTGIKPNGAKKNK